MWRLSEGDHVVWNGAGCCPTLLQGTSTMKWESSFFLLTHVTTLTYEASFSYIICREQENRNPSSICGFVSAGRYENDFKRRWNHWREGKWNKGVMVEETQTVGYLFCNRLVLDVHLQTLVQPQTSPIWEGSKGRRESRKGCRQVERVWWMWEYMANTFIYHRLVWGNWQDYNYHIKPQTFRA